MTAKTQYACDVDQRPAVHLDIPVGDREVPVVGQPDEVEVHREIQSLDLCAMCLARELARFIKEMDDAARRAWIARVRSGEEALHNGV